MILAYPAQYITTSPFQWRTSDRLSFISAILLVCVLLAIPSRGQSPLKDSRPSIEQDSAAEPIEVKTQRFDPSAVDSSIDPCANFYLYACHKWMDSNSIPADEGAFSRMAQMTLHNQWVLHRLLEEVARPRHKTSGASQKVGNYYAACMDETATVKNNTDVTLQKELENIIRVEDKKDLAPEIAHLHQLTFTLDGASDSGSYTALFGFSSSQDFNNAKQVVAIADQGGLTLPNRDYYLADDAESAELRKQYLTHIQRMFELTGGSGASAAAKAHTVLRIETALAAASMDTVRHRDPASVNNKLSREDMRALTPSLDWDSYLKEIRAPTLLHILVPSPAFFAKLEELISRESLDDLKVYLEWKLLNAAAPHLSSAFSREHFDFYDKRLQGVREFPPRWKRCLANVDRDLGDALGKLYVSHNFGGDSKTRTLRLVRELERALARDIQKSEWMEPSTKREALEKLRTIKDKIGYPDHWRDYTRLTIRRDDPLNNAFRSSVFEFNRQLSKIGQPVDHNEWLLTAPSVGAYYDPQLNTITFPAGILQPPYFDKQIGEAINYGALGSLIGHELTHAFDNLGRKFDAKGNLRDWWQDIDAKNFDKRAGCFSREYSNFVATQDLHVNGDLTLGENIADNGGVRLSLIAFRNATKATGSANGLTADQLFFLAYAQSWCSNISPEVLRQRTLSNPHSPAWFRVNGVLSNMPEFQNAFRCRKGQSMVRSDSCRIW